MSEHPAQKHYMILLKLGKMFAFLESYRMRKITHTIGMNNDSVSLQVLYRNNCFKTWSLLLSQG